MSRNQAAWILQRAERTRVKLVHCVARWFVIVTCAMLTYQVLAQSTELKYASEAANVISTKDNNWLLAFALVVANVTLLAVAKAYQQETRTAQITAVETARAMQRMADSIDKLASTVTIHDERAIKFIDNQAYNGNNRKE